MSLRKLFAAAVLAGVALAGPALAQDGKIEKPSLKLSVGGKPLLYYLPVTVAERLGYFKEEGLNVEILDLGGGAKSLQALIGGSVDVTTGAYDHTIQMQAQGKPLVATVLLGRFPGIGLGVVKGKIDSFKSFQDLKGMKIGVTAPGSSTNFMVTYILTHNGLKAEDVSFIGVGGGASAVAAVKRGEIDAISNTDPVISQLERMGDIKVVADTRTEAGTKAIYGGPYPAAVLYMPPDFIKANPNTTQALVNVFVRTLGWMRTHSADEIAAKMPPEYALGDKDTYLAALKNSLEMFAHDGRMSNDGAANAAKVLTAFDGKVAGAKIDLDATWTNAYVEKALKKYP